MSDKAEPTHDASSLSLEAADGVPLLADVWNPSAPVTLLLLPCGGEVRTVWRKVVAAMPEDVKSCVRIVAPDYRGHGDSGRSETYRFAQFLDDLTGWIDVLDARPLVIAGGSIGGALGLVAAGEGAMIDGLVLLDVPTVPVLEKAQAQGRRIQQAGAARHPSVRSIDPAFIDSGFVEDVFRDADRWRRAAVRLQIPTLLVGGTRGVIGGAHPPLYRAHVPHGSFEVVDAGHLVARDAPVETASILARFLRHHWLT